VSIVIPGNGSFRLKIFTFFAPFYSERHQVGELGARSNWKILITEWA